MTKSKCKQKMRKTQPEKIKERAGSRRVCIHVCMYVRRLAPDRCARTEPRAWLGHVMPPTRDAILSSRDRNETRSQPRFRLSRSSHRRCCSCRERKWTEDVDFLGNSRVPTGTSGSASAFWNPFDGNLTILDRGRSG